MEAVRFWKPVRKRLGCSSHPASTSLISSSRSEDTVFKSSPALAEGSTRLVRRGENIGSTFYTGLAELPDAAALEAVAPED